MVVLGAESSLWLLLRYDGIWAPGHGGSGYHGRVFVVVL
jgi:hypothetical protein